MNPGYLSYISILSSMILLGFGWKVQAIGNSSLRQAWLFLAAWIAACALHWELPEGAVAGTLTYLPLMVLAAAPFRRKETAVMEVVSAYLYAVLLGAVASLLQLVEVTAPLWTMFGPFYDLAVAVSVLTIAYTRSPMFQFVILSISLIVNDSLTAALAIGSGEIMLGGRTFQDLWWMTVLSVRAGSTLLCEGRSFLSRSVQRIRPWFSRHHRQ